MLTKLPWKNYEAPLGRNLSWLRVGSLVLWRNFKACWSWSEKVLRRESTRWLDRLRYECDVLNMFWCASVGGLWQIQQFPHETSWQEGENVERREESIQGSRFDPYQCSNYRVYTFSSSKILKSQLMNMNTSTLRSRPIFHVSWLWLPNSLIHYSIRFSTCSTSPSFPNDSLRNPEMNSDSGWTSTTSFSSTSLPLQRENMT